MHSRHRCRVYPDPYHVCFQYGARWYNCWPPFLLSPQGTSSPPDGSIHQSRSSVKKTENMIDALTVLTINAGLITFTAASMHVILFSTSPHTGVHLAFHFIVPMPYTNSLYKALNTRIKFQGKGTGDISVRPTISRGTTHTGQSTVDSVLAVKYGISVSRPLFRTRC